MGRLVTWAIVVGVIAAVAGGLLGGILLTAIGALPEHRIWFVWLSATLAGSVAAISTLVVARLRTRGGNNLRDNLAAVLLGGCAGAVLAGYLYGTSPRGQQIVFFAVGAVAGGSCMRLIRHFGRARERRLSHSWPVGGFYSPTAARCLLQCDGASWRQPIVDEVLKRGLRDRWFQFTLGSLMAFTLIASVTLAFWVRGPMKRRQILTAIERSGGGRVGYASQAPEWIVELLGDVARGLFDEVSEIELRNPTDDDVKRISFFSQLRKLTLAGTVTDEAMKTVAKWQSLEELDLGATNVSSEGLAQLRSLPRLRALVAPQGLDDRGLKAIGELTKLTGLWIYYPRWLGVALPASPSITPGGLVHLANLKDLTELSLSVPWIDDDAIAFIERLRRLKRLQLNDISITDAGLVHLARLQELEWLDLTRAKVTGTGFEKLSGLQQLQRLELGGARVTDDGLKGVATFRNLRSLDLNGTSITDAGLAHLEPLTKLGYLSIWGTSISDQGLVHLESMTDLANFQYERTNITPEGIARLETAWRERRAKQSEESADTSGSTEAP